MSESNKSTSVRRTSPRRAYEAPRLVRVKLESDQVLVSGCKTAAGPSGWGAFDCTANGCAGLGS